MSNHHWQISQLIYRYAEAIDGGQFEALAELFHHATISSPGYGSTAQGREQVLELYRRSTRLYPDTGTPKTQHVTSNLIIEVSGNHAEARSRFTVFQATPELPLQAIISGSYRDQFALVNDAWRFSAREIYPELIGDLSQHLLFDSTNLGQPK